MEKTTQSIILPQNGNGAKTSSGQKKSTSIIEFLRMRAMQESFSGSRNPEGVHYSDGFRDESAQERKTRKDSTRELLRYQPGLYADGFNETAMTDQTEKSSTKQQLKYTIRISKTITFPRPGE